MIAGGLKRQHWSCRSRRIDKIQRGAEEARQSIRQRQPSPISPAQNQHTVDQSLYPNCHLLLIRLGLNPSPQLYARPAFSRAFPRSGAPILSVPLPQAKPQMQFARIGMLENLSKRSREVSKVLLLERCPSCITLEVERG